MTVADKLERWADVPRDLAELVVSYADDERLAVSTLRSASRRSRLVKARQHVAAEARRRGYTFWQIARALNRDHSTIVHAVKGVGR